MSDRNSAPFARRTLLAGAAIVLSGDIHNHLVADLRPDVLDESAPVVGTDSVAFTEARYVVEWGCPGAQPA